MWSKNQYLLLFGPSGDDGMIHVSGEELTRRAQAEQAMFPMDYVSFPAQWSGGIGAEVLTLDGIQRLRDAIRTWGADLYPPDLDRDLDEYELRLETLDDKSIERRGRPHRLSHSGCIREHSHRPVQIPMVSISL